MNMKFPKDFEEGVKALPIGGVMEVGEGCHIGRLPDVTVTHCELLNASRERLQTFVGRVPLAFSFSRPVKCPSCGVAPGQEHVTHECDVERCSCCGLQFRECDCSGIDHNRDFARWTGYYPGSLEAKALGLDLNGFYERGLHVLFFIHPDWRQCESVEETDLVLCPACGTEVSSVFDHVCAASRKGVGV